MASTGAALEHRWEMGWPKLPFLITLRQYILLSIFTFQIIGVEHSQAPTRQRPLWNHL